MEERLASIDIGTNSQRLLVADIINGGLKRLYTKKRIVRLGKGLTNGGKLSEERIKRCVDVTDEYFKDCEQMGAQKILPVGTSPLRKAENAEDVVTRIRERTGLDIVTLSGEEEGYLCFLGVAQGLGKDVSQSLIIDIGGGSTELICCTGYNTKPQILSLPLGMVHLTETFFLSDPPKSSEITNCEKVISDTLNTQGQWVACRSRESVMIGTAGTLTTLAAMDQGLSVYDPDRIQGYRLNREAVERILGEIRSRPRQELIGRAGLEPGREDVILAGTLIAKALMNEFDKGEFLISDWGLLEGIIVRHMNSKMLRESVALQGD
jgi:exopolyphosphatase/guanosine-5'-triphosphate,3'-diphosphate pyrophosphatase